MASILATRFGRNVSQFRNRDDSPLTDDVMRQVAPSIFADSAHESRSQRYAYIPTSTVMAGLREEGFEPFMVGQSRSRIEGKSEFTKHMIRFRHAREIARKDQTEASEIILINSHDGTSSYQMLSGMLRFVCMNGLVCGEVHDDVRIPHKGDVIDQVKEAAAMVLDGTDLVREVRNDMRGIALNRDEQEVFAAAALALRFPEANEARPAPIKASQLLNPRRVDDTATNLWSTFNVAQENVIRGGLTGRNAKNKRTTTREVISIDKDRTLNQALWVLAEGMRRLKNGG